MFDQENGGMICGPLELSKAVVSAALLLRLLRGSDELTIHPTKNYPGCTSASISSALRMSSRKTSSRQFSCRGEPCAGCQAEAASILPILWRTRPPFDGAGRTDTHDLHLRIHFISNWIYYEPSAEV